MARISRTAWCSTTYNEYFDIPEENFDRFIDECDDVEDFEEACCDYIWDCMWDYSTDRDMTDESTDDDRWNDDYYDLLSELREKFQETKGITDKGRELGELGND